MAKKNPKITNENGKKYTNYTTAEELRNKIKDNHIEFIQTDIDKTIDEIYCSLTNGCKDYMGFYHLKPGRFSRMYWNKAKVDAIRTEFESSGYNVIVTEHAVAKNPLGSIYYKVTISI